MRRGKALLDESRKVSAVVSMNIAKEYADNPELLAVFKQDNAEQERKLNEEQARLEDVSRSLQQQATNLAAQQRNTLFMVFGGMSLLVFVIGIAGIVFTHKIAGPIFKMKGLPAQGGRRALQHSQRFAQGRRAAALLRCVREDGRSAQAASRRNVEASG